MTQWTLSLNNRPIKRFNIKEGWNLTIGRGAEADVIVDNTAISRKHASLGLKDGQYILSDLGSLNGTFVNGKKIIGTECITQDDTVNLGKFKLSLTDDTEKMEVSSYGAHPDTEDKTIIVDTKKYSGKAKESDSKYSEDKLVLMEGYALPDKLSLTGKSSIKIGKASSCDMILKGLFVSDAQLYIVKNSSGYKLVPQRSWASTYVNGKRINNERQLSNGDVIKIRSTTIRFCQ